MLERDLETLFKAACQLDGEERDAFLSRVRSQCEELARELEELIESEHEGPMRTLPLPVETTRGSGISLRDLDREPKVHELRTGPEKYEVIRLLGEGGMGKVMLVHDRDLRRRVALKMIRQLGSNLEQRFLEEAQVLGQLEHPNIVPLYEIGMTESNRLFYTMRYLRGQSLKELLKELRRGDKPERQYSITRLVQIFQQVAQAVRYAHDKGVIHRDLKPSNVMLGEHGEVQVLDWGLSKVLDGGTVGTDVDATLTASGQPIGTPLYMAPEQARGKRMDSRSDIYALGVMLYEILTLRLPFEGGAAQIMAALLRDDPVPPRERAPERPIPAELEAVSLRAMKKEPDERYPSVAALLDDVQDWLESEADKAKRREKADLKFAEGAARIDEHRALRERVRELEAEARRQARRFRSQEPVHAKMDYHEAEDAVTAARRRLQRAGSQAVASFTEALGFDPTHAASREALADFYWARFQEAERRMDFEARDMFGELVVAYHGGKYARKLEGRGSLALRTDPPGAEVWIFPLVERDLQLVPDSDGGRLLGTTPLAAMPLAMGSYLVQLKKKGFPDVRYPVFLSRNRDWDAHVRLRTAEEIGDGFRFVPGGPFIEGGDEAIKNWSLPRGEPEVADFYMAEHPVTMEEYLLFLNELAREDPAEAARHAPRVTPEEGSFLLSDDGKTYRLPDETAARDGPAWSPRLPIIGISWHGAAAYCAWRSRREGRVVRLPSETEWQKAARGVDGRLFPWGDRFDPALCNMIDTHDSPAARPVDEHPSDVSVYGVRGLGGNVGDWTSPTADTDAAACGPDDTRLICGGAWYLKDMVIRCANRFWQAPASTVDVGVGFRVARAAE